MKIFKGKLIRIFAAVGLFCLYFSHSLWAYSGLPLKYLEQIKIPQCLALELPSSYKILAANEQFQIVEMPSTDLDKLTLLADKMQCGRFINVSRYFLPEKSLLLKQHIAKNLLSSPSKHQAFSESNLSYAVKYQHIVTEMLGQINPKQIKKVLTHLTTYYNRSAITTRGKEVANSLKNQFEQIALQYNRRDTSTYLVKTGWYKQPSVVTVIGKNLTTSGIVIGAHMDTLDGRMPGAGDDASGSSTIMEIARVLLASKLSFKHPIYIIWYAAEERGLVGSQYVVDDFINTNREVKAAIQFDMTGFRNQADDPTMWIYEDYTDKNLNKFLTELIATYIKVPVNYSKCGYGCSDHVSWTLNGIPSAFPCETSFEDHNPYIHSAEDTEALLNIEHMVNFTKLGLAFAVELAEPQ